MKNTKIISALTAITLALLVALPASANNLALTGPGASADGSSKASNSSYNLARDGNVQTFWQANGNNNQRISVKWSSAVSVNQVVLREQGSNIRSWRLVNNNNGAVLASGTTLGSNRTINFNTISTTKLNLEILTAAAAPRISEFEVFNSSSGGGTGGGSGGNAGGGTGGTGGNAGGGTGGTTGDVLACRATPQGYASLNGGTTGGSGSNAVTVTVSTGSQLQQALNNRDLNRPLTIRVDGTITRANSGSLTKFDIKDMNNVTIIGVGNRGILDGIGIKIWRSNNVIIRNLTIRYVNVGDKDAISIEGPASRIWIDHNDLYNTLNSSKDFYDELVSGKKEVDNVTISYNKLHDSWKTSLWGNNDSDNFNRRITFHHNHWYNVNSRLPLFRYGQAHIFNNLYQNILESGINSRMGATIRIENNVFENTKNPIVSLFSSAVGYWDIRNNQLTSTVWENSPDGVIAGPSLNSTGVLNLPYSFTQLPTNQVKAHVLANAGVNKCNF